MGEVSRVDAFSLVVKNMEKGNRAVTQKILDIIIKSIEQEKISKKYSSAIMIDNAEDASLFGDLLIKVVK